MRRSVKHIQQPMAALRIGMMVCLFRALESAQRFTVASVAPADGATGVDPKTQIVITMSEAVKPESVTTITVFLNNPAGSRVPGVFSLSPDGTVITLYPGQNLASETAYTLMVTHSVQDLQGYFRPSWDHLGDVVSEMDIY